MNPSSALADVLVDELVRGGVRHVVLCPGSRSAPLAYALLDADSRGRLALHVRIDERSAGFVALGLAKASGPVAVVTTSGTAVANLHPAVLEASHGGVPLVLITADRPPQLRGTGANQTTDQVGIFGRSVRWQHDLGVPEQRPGQVGGWRAVVCRALSAATGARGATPGPVHLNVPLREPLVPDDDPTWVEPLEGRPGRQAWVRVSAPGVNPADLDARGRLDLGPRTLVLVGDLPARPADADADWGALAAGLAQERGWPLVAEPSSGSARASALTHGSLLLTCTHWLERHLPQQVLVVGRPTLSRASAALLRDPRVSVQLVSDDDVWPDPGGQVCQVHPLSVLPPLSARAPVPQGPRDETWHQDWLGANRRVAAAVGQLLADPGTWPSGLAVAATLAACVPAGATVFVGSSNPVRDLDLAGAGAARVVANRGLAGIDGCVSTAVGLALGAGAPTYALVGDLTFVHDANGLVVGPHEPQPDLTVVVVNDDGGGIFTLLEPGAPEREDRFERIFATPHGTDLRQLSAALGATHVLVSDRAQLASIAAKRPRGVTVLEVRLDRGAHRALHARLRQAAAGAAG